MTEEEIYEELEITYGKRPQHHRLYAPYLRHYHSKILLHKPAAQETPQQQE